MRFKLMIGVVLLIQNVVCVAQSQTPNTTIQLSLSHFKMPNMYFTPLYNPKIGIDVIRKVSAHFDAQFSLSSMVNIGGGGVNSYIFDLDGSKHPVGQLSAREAFRYVDASVKYNEHIRKHTLFFGVGLSYVQGRNSYIKSFFIAPGYNDALIDKTGFMTERYYGVNAIAGYSFQVSNRINLGLSGKGYVLSKGLKEYNASINVGYSFNAFK